MRERSAKTSIASGPTAKIQGWVSCGLAARMAARSGRKSPSDAAALPRPPRLIGRPLAGRADAPVPGPVAEPRQRQRKGAAADQQSPPPDHARLPKRTAKSRRKVSIAGAYATATMAASAKYLR